jgi:hypothetical protein
MFAQYYANTGFEKGIVVRLWQECARALKIPEEQLRPTDRFDVELAAVDIWASLDDTREDLAAYAMSQAKRAGATIDFKTLETLDDLIRQLVPMETKR